MAEPANTVTFRVRYGETDRMDTIYNARVLEWFEVARTEYLRELGLPYAEIESRGIFFPVTEAHVKFQGRATYDDELEMVTTLKRPSRLRVRFDISICHVSDGSRVAAGYTTHGITDSDGRPTRPPGWLTDIIEKGLKD